MPQRQTAARSARRRTSIAASRVREGKGNDMKRLTLWAGACVCVFALLQPALAQAKTTVTGIPLDAPWKVKIYDLARSHFKHPAWGWQHCERNYQVAMRLAHGDGLRVDADVLFAG